MGWSEHTMESLRRWLAPDTWYPGNAHDDARFFVFVASVWNDAHESWDPVTAREIIASEAKRVHPGSDNLAAKVAAERVSEGTTILDFLSHLREQKQFGLLSP